MFPLVGSFPDVLVYAKFFSGGILAATLNETHIGSWFIPAIAHMVDARPTGISDSYSMIQQGDLTPVL
jgi:hypothetical protein